MRQAALGEAKQEEKKDQRRRVNEVGGSPAPWFLSHQTQAPRPASAEPGRLVEDRKGGGGGNHQGGDRRSFGNSKRLSHHGHLSERSQSHSKSSFSASYSSMNQVCLPCFLHFLAFNRTHCPGSGYVPHFSHIQRTHQWLFTS